MHEHSLCLAAPFPEKCPKGGGRHVGATVANRKEREQDIARGGGRKNGAAGLGHVRGSRWCSYQSGCLHRSSRSRCTTWRGRWGRGQLVVKRRDSCPVQTSSLIEGPGEPANRAYPLPGTPEFSAKPQRQRS